jgi:hypothetical protein
MSDSDIPTVAGFILDLRQLDHVLLAISYGEHQWSRPKRVPAGARWIPISYSNPLYGSSLPNEVVFRFPIFREPLPFFSGRETTYVCLSPFLSSVVQQGLYFEDGDVKQDCFEDEHVFWRPLHEELRKCASLTPCPTLSLSNPDENESQ